MRHALRPPLTRRELLRRAGVATLGLGLLPAAAGPTAAHDEAFQVADVELPPDLGQADLAVYVEATGHTLRGLFLDYWRATGGAAVYGNPISEPFAADGSYSQAFENAVFQYRPEFLWTEEPVVRLMPIGRAGLQGRLGTVRADGRRGLGGGDRRGAAWRPLNPNGETVAGITAGGGVFVEATGHTIAGEFLAWYAFNEGPFSLGAPLSEPLRERGATAQWFEGGLLLVGEEGPSLAPLAAGLAPRLGIDMTPVERGDLPAYDEPLFWTAANPNPLGDPDAPGRKWIEVSSGEQRLWAYQGETAISTSLVSTGLDPNPTEVGRFRVRLKYPEQDMRGFTDATGEVTGFGEASSGGIPYAVEAVPHVMYFNLDAEALHGAYWHTNFGTPMSHGCVNLPLDFAAWLYGWAPLGTAVWVHE